MKVVERIAQEFNATQKGVSELLESTYNNNGYASKEASKFLTEVSTSNILKFADETEYYKVDGKIVGMLGEELVTNGDFSDGTTGWTSGSGGVLTALNHKLTLATVNVDSYSRADQILELQEGKTYTVRVYAGTIENSTAYLRVGSYLSGVDLLDINRSEDGVLEGTFIGKATTYLHLGTAGVNTECYFDNVSVREIKTFDLSTGNDRTGYAGAGDNSFVPHVEVQDQATNGLTVQSAIKKGDYVVVDKLNYNTSLGGSTTSTLDVPSGTFVVGRSYIVSGTMTGLTTGSISISLGGSTTEGVNQITISANGRFVSKLTLSNVPQQTIFMTDNDCDGSLDLFEVTIADDIYKATEDIPSGTSLTDSRFETRDFIDSQVLITMDSNGTPYIEPMNVNAYQKDSVDTVMTNNGFSKKDFGLYTKGDKTVTPIALVNM